MSEVLFIHLAPLRYSSLLSMMTHDSRNIIKAEDGLCRRKSATSRFGVNRIWKKL